MESKAELLARFQGSKRIRHAVKQMNRRSTALLVPAKQCGQVPPTSPCCKSSDLEAQTMNNRSQTETSTNGEWQGKRPIQLCLLHDGKRSPTFALNKSQVTHNEALNGIHYDLADAEPSTTATKKPFTHFDQFEAPAFLHLRFASISPNKSETMFYGFSQGQESLLFWSGKRKTGGTNRRLWGQS